MSQEEISVHSATVDARQRLDLGQLIEVAGQGRGGGQKGWLRERDEVANAGLVLQDC